MSQNIVMGESRRERLARIAHAGLIAAVWLSVPVCAVLALRPWSVNPLKAGVAVAPADDPIRNGLQIQEPVSSVGGERTVRTAASDQRAATLLRTWRYTGSSGGATGVHGGGGNNGSPGH